MIRAGVIGLGSFGRHHARVYSELEEVEFVGVAEPDESRRSAIAGRYKVAAYAHHRELLSRERPDVVSIAVPTVSHYDVALDAMERGVHVLVEKPVASTVEEARDLIHRAAARGILFTVGHLERFNPAVAELKRRLSAGELGRVFQVHARRLSPFPNYVHDVGVVMDLATHELDIMRYLLEADAHQLYAEIGRNVHEEHEDMLSGILRFDGGAVGLLDVNWLTPTKVRDLRITGQRGMFVVNYLDQDLYFYENSDIPLRWDAMALFKGVEEGNVIKIRVSKAEPLQAELKSFVHAVANDLQPVVSGADGLQALALARMLMISAFERRAVCVPEEAGRRGWVELASDG